MIHHIPFFGFSLCHNNLLKTFRQFKRLPDILLLGTFFPAGKKDKYRIFMMRATSTNDENNNHLLQLRYALCPLRYAIFQLIVP